MISKDAKVQTFIILYWPHILKFRLEHENLNHFRRVVANMATSKPYKKMADFQYLYDSPASTLHVCRGGGGGGGNVYLLRISLYLSKSVSFQRCQTFH